MFQITELFTIEWLGALNIGLYQSFRHVRFRFLSFVDSFQSVALF